MPKGMTVQLQEILADACVQMRRCGKKRVFPEHILMALSRRSGCTAAQLLKAERLSTARMFLKVDDCMRKRVTAEKRGIACDYWIISLDLVAKNAEMDTVIGGEQEITTVIEIISRKNKNNSALIGEPGVGKTTIAEGRRGAQWRRASP